MRQVGRVSIVTTGAGRRERDTGDCKSVRTGKTDERDQGEKLTRVEERQVDQTQTNVFFFYFKDVHFFS